MNRLFEEVRQFKISQAREIVVIVKVGKEMIGISVDLVESVETVVLAVLLDLVLVVFRSNRCRPIRRLGHLIRCRLNLVLLVSCCHQSFLVSFLLWEQEQLSR